MLSAGVFGLSIDGDFLGTGIPTSVLMIIPIVAGIIKIVDYDRECNICPKCNHTPMLPLDNPEAINLIKKYDLKVGNNTSPNTQSEPSSDSLETPKP